MSEPKITVVMPTRERANVLEKALATVVAQDYDNLEIVVSDNCSTDGTRDVVEQARDPRIRYVNTGRRVSMTANWEFALSHVQAGWVTVLGDDDGLMPAAISKAAEVIRTTQTRALRSRVCKYSWPSLTGKPWGHLTVPLGHGHEIRDCKSWLAKVMTQGLSYAELPILYNGGFIATDLLEEMKAGTGKLYHSPIPDVYSAVAICTLTDTFVFLHDPLAISGASAHSTGASIFVKKQAGEAGSPAKVFRSEESIPFHPALPRDANGNYPMSVHALVYESWLQTDFLRAGDATSRHEEQLQVMLAVAGKHEDAVVQWARTFADAHGLDFEHSLEQAKRLRQRLRMRDLPRRLRSAIDNFEVGSAQLPIRDIVEATVAAAAIRQFPPGTFGRIQRAVTRAIEMRRGG